MRYFKRNLSSQRCIPLNGCSANSSSSLLHYSSSSHSGKENPIQSQHIFYIRLLKRFTNLSTTMTTKNLARAIAFSLLFTVILVSCKKNTFLDQTVTSSLNETTTFSDSANAMSFLNNIYVNIGLQLIRVVFLEVTMQQDWKLPVMKPKDRTLQA